jgi:hypothetical protein
MGLIVAHARGLQTERLGIPGFSIIAVLARSVLVPFELIALYSLSFKRRETRKSWWILVFVVASIIYITELYSIFSSETGRSVLFFVTFGLDRTPPIEIIDKLLASTIFVTWVALALYICGRGPRWSFEDNTNEEVLTHAP